VLTNATPTGYSASGTPASAAHAMTCHGLLAHANRIAGRMDAPIIAMYTARPPKRSASIPSGIRPKLPISTGAASASPT